MKHGQEVLKVLQGGKKQGNLNIFISSCLGICSTNASQKRNKENGAKIRSQTPWLTSSYGKIVLSAAVSKVKDEFSLIV